MRRILFVYFWYSVIVFGYFLLSGIFISFLKFVAKYMVPIGYSFLRTERKIVKSLLRLLSYIQLLNDNYGIYYIVCLSVSLWSVCHSYEQFSVWHTICYPNASTKLYINTRKFRISVLFFFFFYRSFIIHRQFIYSFSFVLFFVSIISFVVLFSIWIYFVIGSLRA